MKNRKLTWAQVKAVLDGRPEKEVRELLRDLYRLSEENREFVHARLLTDPAAITPYLKTVEDGVYPDAFRGKPVCLADARRAITNYRRATGDPVGTLELMMRYVECGTEFTVDFGGVDERFSSSLTTMFDHAVQMVRALPEPLRLPHLKRLRHVVDRAGAVGWGYQDSISDILGHAFPEDVA